MPNPLETIAKLDPDLMKLIENNESLALDDGALSRKDKLLIAIALDASKGAVQGVQSLSLQALDAGATKEEIMDAVRVAQYINGVGCVYTAAAAFNEIF
ncbi:MAG TPA: carboxymuconolactone decarboxylase family protein [Methanosarcinaceae archaeon]|nr:carboxymuconolactone decarboxylase family protein [Methanosarcinaceae archaeon]